MAEFFMQILDKYKNDYMISLARLKEERKRFGIELSKIEGLRVYPSEANYFLCELLGGYNSTKLAGELLEDNILIKDLSGKIRNGRQYIRVAIRTEEENDKLIGTLCIRLKCRCRSTKSLVLIWSICRLRWIRKYLIFP